jgi:hypothetical protein
MKPCEDASGGNGISFSYDGALVGWVKKTCSANLKAFLKRNDIEINTVRISPSSHAHNYDFRGVVIEYTQVERPSNLGRKRVEKAEMRADEKNCSSGRHDHKAVRKLPPANKKRANLKKLRDLTLKEIQALSDASATSDSLSSSDE